MARFSGDTNDTHKTRKVARSHYHHHFNLCLLSKRVRHRASEARCSNCFLNFLNLALWSYKKLFVLLSSSPFFFLFPFPFLFSRKRTRRGLLHRVLPNAWRRANKAQRRRPLPFRVNWSLPLSPLPSTVVVGRHTKKFPSSCNIDLSSSLHISSCRDAERQHTLYLLTNHQRHSYLSLW